MFQLPPLSIQIEKILSWRYQDILGSLLKSITLYNYEAIIKTTTKHVPSLIQCLKYEPIWKYTNCVDITAIDRPGKKYRFTVLYFLRSFLHHSMSVVITQTNELLPLFSLTSQFKSAAWSEREVWDMFGIFFLKNNDLRRILTDYGFASHPARRDFPLTGFVESAYNDTLKMIQISPVELTQAYRLYRYPKRWSNVDTTITNNGE